MSNPFLGEIKMVAFTYAPRGWAFCNGQLLSISQNTALFSLLGTNFGGDGRTTFALPNLQGRTPIHASATHPLGEAGGEETHTLSLAELPAHAHTLGALQADASQRSAGGRLPAYAAEDTYSRSASLVSMHAQAVANAGGGQAHSNLQPYTVLNFVIALQGIFPSRP
jgi:microcystin-dependent protein